MSSTPSSAPAPQEGRPAVESVAGLLAAAAIFAGITAIAYRPVRLAPAAILLALVSAGMSRRWSTLTSVALAVAGLGWMLGMAIAVVTDHPLW
ncbi:MAG TPA: hypothetical protein VFL66_03610 [Gaiellaceae bacterium]|nr:hypothetical protein [Gaiellaceae bacterium]